MKQFTQIEDDIIHTAGAGILTGYITIYLCNVGY